MKKRDPKDEPWTENYPPLAKWLREHNALCLSQTLLHGTRAKPLAYIETWMIHARCFVVEVRDEQRGWEIYTSTVSSRVDATLIDAEERLGLTSAPPTHIDIGAHVPPTFIELSADERELLGDGTAGVGKVIEAIKALRKRTGCGLTDAKKTVDRYRNQQAIDRECTRAKR